MNQNSPLGNVEACYTPSLQRFASLFDLTPLSFVTTFCCTTQGIFVFQSTPFIHFSIHRMTLLKSLCLIVCLLSSAGCGKTIRQAGTEQLLASDAIDRAVSGIDFSPLSGKTVYFDTQFIRHIKTVGFVNADYIISSMRQQMTAAHCLLQENREAAECIVEARVGTLGADQNELSYGLPASNVLSTASTLVSTIPTLPTIPELSIAKRIQQSAAAKISVFAYLRETKEPIWQSGIQKASSKSREFWVLGAGPFQRGEIYDGTQLAGSTFRLPFTGGKKEKPPTQNFEGVPYGSKFVFTPSKKAKIPDGLTDKSSNIELASQSKVIQKSSPNSKEQKPADNVQKPAKELRIPQLKGPVYRMTDPIQLTK